MESNLDRVKTRARLLLERDVPALIAVVEQLRRELAEAKRRESQPCPQLSAAPPVRVRGPGEARLMTIKEFALAMGVTESTVRDWRLRRKINVVKVSRLVRIPRTEVERIIDEGAIPKRITKAGR